MPSKMIENEEAYGPPQRRDAKVFDLITAVRPQAGLESQRLSTFSPGFVNSLKLLIFQGLVLFETAANSPSCLVFLRGSALVLANSVAGIKPVLFLFFNTVPNGRTEI